MRMNLKKNEKNMNLKNWKEITTQELVNELSPEGQDKYHELTAIHAAARALSAARKQQGLTQKALAALMKTTQAQVHRLETASPDRTPSLGSLMRAATALNLEVVISFKKVKTKLKPPSLLGI